MGVFDKVTVETEKVIPKITYVNVKSKQEETVVKGSRAERLFKKSKSWKEKVVPTK